MLVRSVQVFVLAILVVAFLVFGGGLFVPVRDVALAQKPATPARSSSLDTYLTFLPLISNFLITQGQYSLALGYHHTCGLTSAAVPKCWGRNADGQLGNGTTTGRTTPFQVSGLGNTAQNITAGMNHTCVLTYFGGVKCWGWNEDGELGDGTRTTRLVPVDVSGLTSGVAAVAAGTYHTCALTQGGAVLCWGWNPFGQLGEGTLGTHLTPTPVSGLTSGVIAIAAGGAHTCALLSGGSIKCWGDNERGQLGDGTTFTRTTPVSVSGITNATAIAAGQFHTCARTAAGAVMCWGNNLNGQLGDGTTTTTFPFGKLTPVQVSGITSGATLLTTGANHSCAALATGGIKCWGWNYMGQLGDTTTTDRPSPVYVYEIYSIVKAVRGGAAHTCTLAATDAVRCWGQNYDGQVGDGTTTTRLAPSNVIGF